MHNLFTFSNTRNLDLKWIHQVDLSSCYVAFACYLLWNDANAFPYVLCSFKVKDVWMNKTKYT